MASQALLLRTLVELADTLVDDFDVIELLSGLTERCIEAFNVSDAGILLAAPVGSELQVVATTSVEMRNIELFELQAREGPCVDCYRSGQPVLNQLLESPAALRRWPRFSVMARQAGFESVTALPLRLRATTLGALNLFRAERTKMTADELGAAQALADVATIAILQHQAARDANMVNDQLQHALTSRIVIEQAKGVLAERANTSVDDAFTMLRHYTRATNRQLGETAQAVVNGMITLQELRAH